MTLKVRGSSPSYTEPVDGRATSLLEWGAWWKCLMAKLCACGSRMHPKWIKRFYHLPRRKLAQVAMMGMACMRCKREVIAQVDLLALARMLRAQGASEVGENQDVAH